jgi:hypothetical protein
MPVKSKKQAKFMGVVAGGKKKVKGLTPTQAKEILLGVKISKLPLTKKKK